MPNIWYAVLIYMLIKFKFIVKGYSKILDIFNF